jgi:hypothetical protein
MEWLKWYNTQAWTWVQTPIPQKKKKKLRANLIYPSSNTTRGHSFPDPTAYIGSVEKVLTCSVSWPVGIKRLTPAFWLASPGLEKPFSERWMVGDTCVQQRHLVAHHTVSHLLFAQVGGWGLILNKSECYSSFFPDLSLQKAKFKSRWYRCFFRHCH